MNKTKIDGFSISFFGYFPKEADSLNIKIKRGGKFVYNYNDEIPRKIYDSLRHLRYYDVNKEIYLSDTVFVKIKNEKAKKISDFKYLVRPQRTMLKKDWVCDFYELKVDDIIQEGGSVSFINKNWKFIQKNEFKKYYGNIR